jgi:predicted ArsR family transcriptional regulator
MATPVTPDSLAAKVLLHLDEHDQATDAQLATALGVEPEEIEEAMRFLADAGLVQRYMRQ